MRNDVKPIVAGALAVAFMGIFYLSNQLSGGLFEVFLIFISPLPSLLFTIQYDNKLGFWVVICGLLIGFILGNFVSIFYLAAGFLGGYIVAILMKLRKSRSVQIAGLFATLLLANFAMFFIFANMFGYNFAQEVDSMVDMMASVEMIQQVFSLDMLKQIMPVCIIAALLLDSYLTALAAYLLATLVLIRLKLYILPDNNRIKPSKWVGYIYMIGLLGYLFSNRFLEYIEIYAILSLVGMVCMLILTYYGYKALKFHLIRKNRSQQTWLIALVMILLFPLSVIIFALLGFLYISSDFFENVLK